MTPEISVVVPVYNEAELVKELCSRLADCLDQVGKPYEILIVDDGSVDQTLAVLKECRGANPNIKVVELSRNFGQTAALAAGIDQAKGAIIVTMDGDLQHSPEEIPRFLAELEKGYDVVSGWRQIRTDNFWLRRLPSLCANALMRKLSGIPIKDFGSTYKAYRAEVLKKVQLFGELHRFIPVLAHRVGARTTEIPIEVHPRVRGSSKYGLQRSFGVFQDIIFLDFYVNHLTKPIRAFGKLFLIFFGTGFALSALLMFAWLIGSIARVLDHGALLLFSVFMMIVGVQFLVTGVLAELLSRIYLKTSNIEIYVVRKIYD